MQPELYLKKSLTSIPTNEITIEPETLLKNSLPEIPTKNVQA